MQLSARQIYTRALVRVRRARGGYVGTRCEMARGECMRRLEGRRTLALGAESALVMSTTLRCTRPAGASFLSFSNWPADQHTDVALIKALITLLLCNFDSTRTVTYEYLLALAFYVFYLLAEFTG